MVAALPAVAGRRGRPCRKPGVIVIQGDRAYWSAARHARLAAQGIIAVVARPRSRHGSGLGVLRWVVERTLAWLHRFRRLALRYERRADVHEAFLTLGCALITWNYVKAPRRVF
jgi:transposase